MAEYRKLKDIRPGDNVGIDRRTLGVVSIEHCEHFDQTRLTFLDGKTMEWMPDEMEFPVNVKADLKALNLADLLERTKVLAEGIIMSDPSQLHDLRLEASNLLSRIMTHEAIHDN